MLLASDKCHCFQTEAFTPQMILTAIPTWFQFSVVCSKAAGKESKHSDDVNNREGSDRVSEEPRCQVGYCLLDEYSSEMTCQGLTLHMSNSFPCFLITCRVRWRSPKKLACTRQGLTVKSNEQEKYSTFINIRGKGSGSFNPCAGKLRNIDHCKNVCLLLFAAW